MNRWLRLEKFVIVVMLVRLTHRTIENRNRINALHARLYRESQSLDT